MSESSDKPAGGPNKFLPTLGMDLVAAKPKVSVARAAPPPLPAKGNRVTKEVVPEIVFSGDVVAGTPVLDEMLAFCESANASDLHLAPGHKPLVRVHGELAAIPGSHVLSGQETENISEGMMNSGQQAALEEFGAADGACSSPKGSRYRFNIFRRQGKRAIVLRRLEERFRTLAELGLPDDLYKLA
ncbi:MAG TPA: hypothetical protein VGN88_01195, partial [Phycisphaerae bacterium]